MVPALSHPCKLMEDDLARLQALLARLWDEADSRLSAVVECLETAGQPASGFVKSAIVLDRQEIERQTLRLIALRQPVADDLRFVMATLLASVELEGVADHASSVLKRLRACALLDEIQAREPLARLAGLALAALRDLREALGQRDPGQASRIVKRDKDINGLHSALSARLRQRMTEAPETAEECSHLLLVCKSLERVGDHVKHVAARIQLLEERPELRLATA